jgi:hypothetical protein
LASERVRGHEVEVEVEAGDVIIIDDDNTTVKINI